MVKPLARSASEDVRKSARIPKTDRARVLIRSVLGWCMSICAICSLQRENLALFVNYYYFRCIVSHFLHMYTANVWSRAAAQMSRNQKKNVVCVNVRHDPRSFGPIKLAAPPLVI